MASLEYGEAQIGLQLKSKCKPRATKVVAGRQLVSCTHGVNMSAPDFYSLTVSSCLITRVLTRGLTVSPCYLVFLTSYV